MDRQKVTARLQRELWNRWGTTQYPAEWDGRNYGGGKLSQRYWEYMKAIEMLELDANAVVLDIGGGSPETGLGFFSSLLSTAAKKVLVMDPNVGSAHAIPENVQVLRQLADFESLKATFSERPDITHVTCISVFEHVPADVRIGITRAINEFFGGSRFVLTLEYHPIHCFFEHQLTARSLSELVSPLHSFCPVRMESSPVFAENAFLATKSVRLILNTKRLLRKIWPQRLNVFVPQWYPLALAFDRYRE